MGEFSLLASLVALALLVGLLIGCVGVGGVLLVPAMTLIVGVNIHTAIATCMFSYLFSGLIGIHEYARRRSIKWSMCGWLCAGAMPGAFAGALAATYFPADLLITVIALLMLFSGVFALGRQVQRPEEQRSLGVWRLFSLGLITGFGSALSGTGGPLILVPMLLWLRIPVLIAIGLSQVIQVPVALLASVANIAHGQIDFLMGFAIAIMLVVGVSVGARIAHFLQGETLRKIVAGALILFALLIVGRVGHQWVI